MKEKTPTDKLIKRKSVFIIKSDEEKVSTRERRMQLQSDVLTKKNCTKNAQFLRYPKWRQNTENAIGMPQRV